MSQLTGNGSQPGDWEELEIFCVGLGPRGFKRKAGRSRVNREIHARICGGLEVKFPAWDREVSRERLAGAV
jgi:hypothetical protein